MQYKGYYISDEDSRLIGMDAGCTACENGVQEGHFLCGVTPSWVLRDDNLFVTLEGDWKVIYSKTPSATYSEMDYCEHLRISSREEPMREGMHHRN